MRVLVIGGGVAGPVLAMALQRVGVEAEVFEVRGPNETERGSWLNFQANGLDALRAIDAAGPLETVGYEVDTISFVNGAGRSLGSLPMAAHRPDGLTSRMIARQTLQRVLHESAEQRGILVHHSKRLAGAYYERGRVVAEFDDGTRVSADLLVGADGVRSRVRTLIDQAATAPRYVPVLNVGGYIPDFRVDVPAREFRMQFGTRCFFAWMPTPDGGTVWFANPPQSAEPRRGELEALTDAQWRHRLLALMADDRGPASAIIDAAPGPLEGWATYDLPAVRRWHDGRGMVLIGDAAHAVAPSAGQGASMALEDAVELARCIRDSIDIPTALSTYERLRRGRTERIVRHGHRSANEKAAGPLARRIRDAILPTVFRHASRDDGASMTWLQGHHIDFNMPVEPAGEAA